MANKSIILGVFGQYYEEMSKRFNATGYGLGWINEGLLTQQEHFEAETVADSVKIAATNADEIYFLLDKVKLPLKNDSITCQELMIILRHKNLFVKTKFYINGKNVKKKFVKQRISESKTFKRLRNF